MECEILIKIPQGISIEWISSDCHSAFHAVVLHCSNSLHWSVLFSYRVKNSDSCIGIPYVLEAISAFKSMSEAVKICCSNCGQGHTCVFMQLVCAILPQNTSPPFSFTWFYRKKMDKAGRKLKLVNWKWGVPAIPPTVLKPLWEFLSLDSSESFSGNLSMGPLSQVWKDRTLNWYTRMAFLINDPGIAEGCKENFSVLNLVLLCLQKRQAMTSVWKNEILVLRCKPALSFSCWGKTMPSVWLSWSRKISSWGAVSCWRLFQATDCMAIVKSHPKWSCKPMCEWITRQYIFLHIFDQKVALYHVFWNKQSYYLFIYYLFMRRLRLTNHALKFSFLLCFSFFEGGVGRACFYETVSHHSYMVSSFSLPTLTLLSDWYIIVLLYQWNSGQKNEKNFI